MTISVSLKQFDDEDPGAVGGQDFLLPLPEFPVNDSGPKPVSAPTDLSYQRDLSWAVDEVYRGIGALDLNGIETEE